MKDFLFYRLCDKKREVQTRSAVKRNHGDGIGYQNLFDSNEKTLCYFENEMSNEKKAFIHSFIPDISIASLQAHYYSEAPPLHRRYCVGVNTPQCYRQLRVKNLQSKVHTWWLE